MEALRSVLQRVWSPAPNSSHAPSSLSPSPSSNPAPFLDPSLSPAPSLDPAPFSDPAPSFSHAPFSSPAPSSGPAPRPFWLLPRVGEGRPRGVLAASLKELREQAMAVLSLPLPPRLALAQDGTVVDDEGFWGTLPPHTALVALGEGQRWAPPLWDLGRGLGPAPPPPPERWEMWGTQRVLRELLRVMAALSRALGHALLGIAAGLRPLLEGGADHAHRH